jgi:hypothetical protein
MMSNSQKCRSVEAIKPFLRFEERLQYIDVQSRDCTEVKNMMGKFQSRRLSTKIAFLFFYFICF